MTTYVTNVRKSMPAVAWWVVCVCLGLAFLYPLYVMLTMALKQPAQSRV